MIAMAEMTYYLEKEVQRMIDIFETHEWILGRQLEGITHEEALLQLPFRGNCMNWVLGHIAASRNSILKLLGLPLIWTEAEIARYKRGSEPVTSGDDALRLEKILADLATMQVQIVDGLKNAAPEALSAVAEGSDKMVIEAIGGLVWHEGYHIGQPEFLRQLAGKNDRRIG